MKGKALALVVVLLIFMLAAMLYRQHNAPLRFIGVTAECRDGTYTASKSRRGSCSGHGGVKRWLDVKG